MSRRLASVIELLQKLDSIRQYEITIKTGKESITLRPLEDAIIPEVTEDEVEDWFTENDTD